MSRQGQEAAASQPSVHLNLLDKSRISTQVICKLVRAHFDKHKEIKPKMHCNKNMQFACHPRYGNEACRIQAEDVSGA